MNNVTVFMSTFNGEKYIEEQIDSILNQEDVNVTLFIRDDGSTDKTLDILREYEKKKLIHLYTGKNLGYGKSFLHLFRYVNIHTPYYAFADQDDVWEPTKLKNAILELNHFDDDKSKLYFSNLKLVDSNLNYIKEKSFPNLKLTLGSAFVRQRIAGCTMVFNDKLFELARKCDFDDYSFHISHEWIYILCLAVGGNVFYDKNAYILYRRHDNTTTSLGRGIFGRLETEMRQFNIAKYNKSELAKIILNNYKFEINNNSRDLIILIANYRYSLLGKVKLLFNKKLDAGNTLFNGKTKLAILFNKY